MLLELGLEAGEEREGVGGRAREAGQHPVVVHLADLAGARLHDGLARPRPARRPPPRPGRDAGRETTVVAWIDAEPSDVIASSGSSQVARGCAASYTRIRCSGLTCV